MTCGSASPPPPWCWCCPLRCRRPHRRIRGLALLTSRLRQLATGTHGRMNAGPVRLSPRVAPVAAGLVVLASGLAFTVAAIGQLA